MKAVLIASAVALFVGIGIGATGSGGGETTPSAAAEPVPTVTVTTETKGETEVITKTETPQSCLDAIEAAEEVARGVVVFADAASTYPELVGEAFQAGLLGNEAKAQGVLSKMEKANAGMDDGNAIVLPAVQDFNEAKEACRS